MTDLFGNESKPKKKSKPKTNPGIGSHWVDEMRARALSEEYDLRVINFGAGVQSTTVLLMMLDGEITPAADCAIFSDTQYEPAEVYEHLEFMIQLCEERGFPVHVVTAGNIKEDITEKGLKNSRFASMPFHVENAQGKKGMLRRQCTREYKIRPIEKKIREILGYKPGQHVKKRVEQWMGISWDEMQRMKENRTKWAFNRYPLIERRMTRVDCLQWLKERGYPQPPKSSCIGCPFHDDRFWRHLKNSSPEEWEDAVKFDKKIRESHGLRGVDAPEAFIHQTLVPLEEVVLLSEEELGQLTFDGMSQECDGYCGI